MKKYLLSITHVLVLCLVIFVVSGEFIHQANLIGLVLIGLSLICLISLKFHKLKFVTIYPDIIFGVIDNGILAVMALFGGEIAGTLGAVIGGVVGNSITDGIAGLFEGYWAEKYETGNRTTLGSAVGKMLGCLLGAGIVLLFANFLSFK